MASFEDGTRKNNRNKDNWRQRPPQYFARKSGNRVYEDDLEKMSSNELDGLYEEVNETLDSMIAQRDRATDWEDEPNWFYPLKVKIKCASSFMEIMKELIGDTGDESLSAYFMKVCQEELQPSEYEYFVKEAERRQKGEPESV